MTTNTKGIKCNYCLDTGWWDDSSYYAPMPSTECPFCEVGRRLIIENRK
jgi:hypothetical protein